MADTYDFGPDPLDDDDLSPKQMLAGLISPASAQSLVLPPPNTPPQTGAAQTTPQTGSLRYAPTQAQPKVSGPPMIPGVAARPETLGLGNSSKITPSAITASQINAAGPGKLPTLSPAMPNLGIRSSQVIAPRGTVAGDTAEYNRLQNTGAGVDQIKNRWGRILGKIGDVAESVVAPGVAQFTPGTTLNHQRLLNQAAGRVNQDYAGQQAQAELADTQSQTQQRNAQAQANAPRAITAEEAATMGDPTLEGQMWTPKAIAAYTGTQSKNQATLGKQKSALEAQAAKNGQIVTFDDQGNPTFKDDPNSAAYQARAALNNYRDSMQKIAAIRADIASQAVTPGSPAWNQKQQQLSIEQERAQSYWGNYLERAKGVDISGDPLNGIPETTNGRPIGTTIAPQYAKNAANIAKFQDIYSSIDNADAAIDEGAKAGVQFNSAGMAAALADPKTTAAQWATGKINTTLSPQEQNIVITTKALREQVQAMRSSLGGGISDSQVDRLQAQLPSATTPSLSYARKQLATVRQQLDRLQKGLPAVNNGPRLQRPGAPANPTNPGGVPDQIPKGQNQNAPKLTPQQRLLIRPGKGQVASDATLAAYGAQASGNKAKARALLAKDGWKIGK